MSSRSTIPLEVKRILRQEAGFGCCICGNPLIEYHHIVPWEHEQHFRPQDMMVLCPNHHTEAPQIMNEQKQRWYKMNPRNIQQGYTKGRIILNGGTVPVVQMGSIEMIGSGNLFATESETLLSIKIEQGAILLSFKLYGEDRELLCEVNDNEWRSGNFKAWDIEWKPNNFRIRQRKGKVNLDLCSKMGDYLKLKGYFFCEVGSIVINNNAISLNTEIRVAFKNLTLINSQFILHSNSIEHKPYLGNEAQLISWPDRLERIRRGLVAWKKLEA